MRSEEFDDEHLKRDKSDDYLNETPEDAKKINLFHTISKYALISFAAYVSLIVILGSNSLFIASLFIGFIWASGIWLYRKRNNIEEWFSGEDVNKNFSRKKKTEAEPKTRLTTLDEESSRPLSDYERANWDSITHVLVNEKFDVLKPFEKKKKKDK